MDSSICQTHTASPAEPGGLLGALAAGLTSTSYTFEFVSAKPGRWRIWALGAEGHEGPKPRPREFRYTR